MKDAASSDCAVRALALASRVPPELLGLADPLPRTVRPAAPAAIVGVNPAPDEETEPMRRSALLAGTCSRCVSGAAGGPRVGGRPHARIGGPSFTEWLDATYPVKG
jgi:hypothetical protein